MSCITSSRSDFRAHISNSRVRSVYQVVTAPLKRWAKQTRFHPSSKVRLRRRHQATPRPQEGCPPQAPSLLALSQAHTMRRLTARQS
ncbi:Hypothetical predicted protein [Cloeon dipterum]|uniref:Uncharacterized protein n=1 Tax=Cloeon dipterum TaxID=197152 RepID=A0A8S1CJ16_9INSE|nr:Hypothetical predicted protein [Cloeon dipterum]